MFLDYYNEWYSRWKRILRQKLSLWLQGNKYKPEKYEENNKFRLQEFSQNFNRFFSEYEKEKKDNMV